MPKHVDREERRRHISEALARIATTRGLHEVSFREVASEAHVSVSLVQHYFGTKQQLLVDSLNMQSERMAERIRLSLARLGSKADPLKRIEAIATSFIPTDDESRSAMLLYLGFGGAALTDPALRGAEAFRNGVALTDTISSELGRAVESGRVGPEVVPQSQARLIVAAILGLSLTVLLGQVSPDEALDVVRRHLSILGGPHES